MSGHSKWSTIKRKKGAADAKRGQLFTKIIKEITVAARMGGGDPGGNPRLRLAIEKAREGRMPGDNIERAIKRGTGELEGVNYEEITYEGYGPSGVALMISSLTDNKTRTVAEIRNIFTKKGGNLGETGSVGWIFDKKGVITFEKQQVSEDKLMEIGLNAGAEDIKDNGDSWDVITEPASFETVKQALEKEKLIPVASEISMIPKTTVSLGKEDAEKMLKLMEALEEHDDIQNVYANFDIPEDIMKGLSG